MSVEALIGLVAGVAITSGVVDSALESESTRFALGAVSREDQEYNEDEDSFSKGSKDLRFAALELIDDFWVRVDKRELLCFRVR